MASTPSTPATPVTSSPATQSVKPPAPLSQIVLHKSDLEDDSLPLLNQILTNQNQLINYLLGHAGEISLNNHLNLGGKTIKGVAPTDPNDPGGVVTQAFGAKNYGAAAIAPLIESLGKNVMKSYRRLNDQNQQEKHSSFLNSCQSTGPTANTSFVTFDPPGGGTVAATVGAGFHQKLDGSVIPYASRTDTLALPSAFAITSLTRASNIVTYVGAATGLGVGDGFTVINSSVASFDGTFVVLQVLSSTSFTYFQGGPDDGPHGGGSISVGGVYYYTLSAGQSVLSLVGGFSSDTWTNRREASFDGTTIIAVVVTTAAGGNIVQSAGGGTPPQSGSAVTVVRRL